MNGAANAAVISMKRLPTAAIIVLFMLAAPFARAQVSLAPPGVEKPPATKPTAKPAESKPRSAAPSSAKKPSAPPAPNPPAPKPASPPATQPGAAAPPPDDPRVDPVYGAFQRDQYKTAFDLATARAQAGDIKAMTMLGELYANKLGTNRDDAKAAEWYKRAADGGDREAKLR